MTFARSAPAACGVLLLAIALAQEATAQARRQTARRERVAAGSVDPVSVRAEYASALLQARRYPEAAGEYRRLLRQRPGNFDWRLNYARALAWGGAYREAEVELKALSARAPRNVAVEELLRSARANLEPSSREARAWVAERPTYTPYRLALARAYVRERRARSAFSHFDAVLARQPSVALFAEAGDARAAGGDRRGAVDLYRRAIERAPTDAAMRRSYASALAANRQYAAAIEQYTLLLDERPDPRLLIERADVRRRSGDETGAEADLNASLALRPTPEAYVALGDMYRWRGQFKRARTAYEEATALRPNDARSASRLALLTREQRPGFGYASAIDEQRGVTAAGRATADNTGFVYVAAGGRVGYALGEGTVLGVGVEPRVVYDASPGGSSQAGESTQRIVGAAATAGLGFTYHGEETDTRITGRGGFAAHSPGDAIPVLAGSAVVTYRGSWSLSLEGTEGPAYDNVMALAIGDDPALFPVGGSGGLLRSRTFAVGVAAPFGIADVGAEYESMWLSDGNMRSAFQGSVRVPLRAGLSLLYMGGSLTFAERSSVYWDPPEYQTHALGLELGARSDEGVAFTARVLPGVARAVEGLTFGDPDRVGSTEPGAARFVGQLAASADLSVRRPRWETALGAAFGTGRAGGYRRFDGHLRVRYIP
jgi:tetratricopeptide (TPR) repeat protein